MRRWLPHHQLRQFGRQFGRNKVMLIGLLMVIGIVSACGSTEQEPVATEAPPDAVMLLTDAINNIRQVASFQMLIEQRGVPFIFSVTLGDGQGSVNAELIRAEAQYITPDVMYAKPRIRVLGAPLEIELFARDTTQWLKALGSDWQQFIIAEDFNAADLVREGSGFDKALNNLRDLQYIDQTTLIDGSSAYHVRGLADGQVIYDLLFGLLEVDNDNVVVDVYINPETLLPVQLEVVLVDTATEDNPEDTTWYVELYDFGIDAIFEAPDGGDL